MRHWRHQNISNHSDRDFQKYKQSEMEDWLPKVRTAGMYAEQTFEIDDWGPIEDARDITRGNSTFY